MIDLDDRLKGLPEILQRNFMHNIFPELIRTNLINPEDVSPDVSPEIYLKLASISLQVFQFLLSQVSFHPPLRKDDELDQVSLINTLLPTLENPIITRRDPIIKIVFANDNSLKSLIIDTTPNGRWKTKARHLDIFLKLTTNTEGHSSEERKYIS
jgi:hypothetical protein